MNRTQIRIAALAWAVSCCLGSLGRAEPPAESQLPASEITQQPNSPAKADAGTTAIFAFREADELWYPVKVESAEGPKSLVRYDDGTTEWREKAKIASRRLRLGSDVYARRPSTGKYDTSIIVSLDGQRIRVRFGNGEVEDTTIAKLRMNFPSAALLQVGVRVFARWAPDGYWYSGSIVKIENRRYLVHFDDGQEAWADEHGIYKYTVSPGDRVGGNWIGQGRYYPGTVTTKNGQRIHIRYDDGNEEDTTIDQVRLRLSVDDNGQ